MEYRVEYGARSTSVEHSRSVPAGSVPTCERRTRRVGGEGNLYFLNFCLSVNRGQKSYNCIPPSAPSICDLLIYWRGVGGVLRQYVASYPSKRTPTEPLKQNRLYPTVKINCVIYLQLSLTLTIREL